MVTTGAPLVAAGDLPGTGIAPGATSSNRRRTQFSQILGEDVPVHVLMVTQPLDGGVFRHVSDLCTGLSGRGHRVTLAGPWPRPPDHPDFVPLQLPLQRSVSARDDARATAALVAAVRRLRPDIVHAHSAKAGALTRLAKCVRPGTPVVYTPHGYAFAGYFSPSSCLVYRLVERGLAPLTSAVVAVCEAERDLAEQTGTGRRVRVVYNGVRPLDHERGRHAMSPPTLTALTMFRPGKGLETLIDAMPEVLREVPRARLRLVGDGPDRQALERHARAVGVGESVDFLGTTTDVPGALRGTSVFVHPSWAESFPYAVLDAMALGLPVVATAVGGVGEAVKDGVNGRLISPANAGAIASAAIPLLQDAELAATLGAQARRDVQRFSVDEMVRRTEAIYTSSVARQSR